jgi:hypothetical protein
MPQLQKFASRRTARAGGRQQARLVSNMDVFQWDTARDGIYVLLGHAVAPIWLTPEQTRRWVQENPDHTYYVTSACSSWLDRYFARVEPS